jgi:cytochrome c553
MRVRSFIPVVLLAACGEGTPAQPTWTGDVQPILVANCVRCHGGEDNSSAPKTFRLDMQEDIFNPRQRHYVGAKGMIDFAIARAEAGEMPPVGPKLTDRQLEILRTWAGCVRGSGECGDDFLGDVGDPTVSIVEAPAGAVDDAATFVFDLSNPNGRPLGGTLFVDDLWVGMVSDGRNTVVLDTSILGAGAHELLANVSDEGEAFGVRTVTVTEFTVEHANAAPFVRTEYGHEPRVNTASGDSRNFFNEIFHPDEEPYTFTYELEDADGDAPTVTVHAVLGDTIVELTPGACTPAPCVTFTPSALDEGTRWKLRFTADDGMTTHVTEAGDFIVSHATTTENCASIADLNDGPLSKCTLCHSSSSPVSVPNTLNATDCDNASSTTRGARGLIYRRVIELRDMPPPSAAHLGQSVPLGEEQRARLAEWLLAGAPQ